MNLSLIYDKWFVDVFVLESPEPWLRVLGGYNTCLFFSKTDGKPF